MKILLIAYEFPPSPSPQSLRWAYLSNRLAAQGHEVHVLAPDIGGSMEGLPDPGPGVQIHRTFPGPVRALLAALARLRPAVSDVANSAGRKDGEAEGGFTRTSDSPAAPDVQSSAEPPRLNWKGRSLEQLQALVSQFVFPDLRAEWKRPARKALYGLLNNLEPDVVVSSHEPATTLQLGLEAKRRGFAWVADLGDPVLAPYTPRKWQPRAAKLEAAVMGRADHVLVTAEEAGVLLRERHGGGARVSVVTQGFDERLVTSPMAARDPHGPLELLYAGRFYSFRNPRSLVYAVLEVPGVRLSIAGGNVDGWLLEAARANPGRLRLLGRLPHRRLLLLQREADVLINLANVDASQVPGKFYEYLGAARPILHVRADAEPDASGQLLHSLRRGWSCPGDQASIAAVLRRLATAQREGRLDSGLDLRPECIQEWSWSCSARAVEEALRTAVVGRE